MGNGEISRMSNFSFSCSVFYPFGKLSTVFIEFKIVVCKIFQFGRVQTLSLGKELKRKYCNDSSQGRFKIFTRIVKTSSCMETAYRSTSGQILTFLFFYKQILFIPTNSVAITSNLTVCLILSQTSLVFYVSSVQVF